MLVTEFADLSDPVFQAQESAVIGDIIHKENANRKSVVNCGYKLEFLRTRSVPDLSSYSLIAIWEWHRLEFVFDTVILFRFWNEAPVADVQKQISFANMLVADYYDFVKIIKLLTGVVNSAVKQSGL